MQNIIKLYTKLYAHGFDTSEQYNDRSETDWWPVIVSRRIKSNVECLYISKRLLGDLYIIFQIWNMKYLNIIIFNILLKLKIMRNLKNILYSEKCLLYIIFNKIFIHNFS